MSFWFDKVYPEDRDRVHDSVYDAINDHANNWSPEYRFLKSDGNYAYISTGALSWKMNSGHLTVLLVDYRYYQPKGY
ncbi:PAS domain-containing protein [Mucilaginibacter sp. Mucisp86]|uniref:PAS domain-containing protein n=1 Tax=Mucilaginibacter rubeus TaxID=2027860 RepID=A0A5C1ICZ5_9SPHI|nr:PAS domain-containing protein [Mucilaginibacter rubeus]